MTYVRGWFQIAFEKDLESEITPLSWGGMELMAIRRDGDVRVYDAICPHRGANLAHGGEVVGDCVRCPFHHYTIGLGGDSEDGFRCREYASALVGGVLLMRLSDDDVPDLPAALREIAEDHDFVNGFEMPAATTPQLIIENGFDNAHFKAVHKILNRPDFAVSTGDRSELIAEGIFQIPPWAPERDPNPIEADYRGRAFSPGVFVAELRGDPPFNYAILTTASPTEDPRQSKIRLTLCLPKKDKHIFNEYFVKALLDSSREGLEDDRAIWERLDLDAPNKLTKSDEAVVAFQEFCASFENGAA